VLNVDFTRIVQLQESMTKLMSKSGYSCGLLNSADLRLFLIFLNQICNELHVDVGL